MFCPKCGILLSDDAEMCLKCGHVINNSFGSNPAPSEKSSINMSSVLSTIGTIIVLILIIRFITMPDEDRDYLINDVAHTVNELSQEVMQEYTPDYITSIKNNPPPGYDTNQSLGSALDRYFSNCKWTTETGSVPRVRFIGMANNGNGTYSKAEIMFSITEMNNNEFYYNIESVVVDGVDLGVLGIYYFWEEIYSGASY